MSNPKQPKKKSTNRVDLEPLLNNWRLSLPLSTQEKRELWVGVNQHVLKIANRYFRKSTLLFVTAECNDRPGFDYDPQTKLGMRAWDEHLSRVTDFYAFIKGNPDKSIGWCFTAYRFRFHLFEARRQAKEAGIELGLTMKTGVMSKPTLELVKMLRHNTTTRPEPAYKKNVLFASMLRPEQLTPDVDVADDLSDATATYSLSYWLAVTDLVLAIMFAGWLKMAPTRRSAAANYGNQYAKGHKVKKRNGSSELRHG
jgi:hypothetical protein